MHVLQHSIDRDYINTTTKQSIIRDKKYMSRLFLYVLLLQRNSFIVRSDWCKEEVSYSFEYGDVSSTNERDGDAKFTIQTPLLKHTVHACTCI